MSSGDGWRDKIGNYLDTIQALVGFANFYRFDDSRKAMRDDIVLVQGWRFTAIGLDGSGQARFVTPDLAILAEGFVPVVVEAKKSFPLERDHWKDDFAQIEPYGRPLEGWPNGPGRVDQHDLVLLVHQSRAVAVITKLREQVSLGKVRFDIQPCVVEFNRSNERQSYIFFRCQDGAMKDRIIAGKLREGTQVPSAALLREYSTVKLYDAPAPMPYFLQVIWDNVIAVRAEGIRPLAHLRRRQKIEVTISVAELREELQNRFTFRSLCPLEDPRQPTVPGAVLIEEACEVLVAAGLAKWNGTDRGKSITVRFQKFETDVLDKFIEILEDATTKGGKSGELFH